MPNEPVGIYCNNRHTAMPALVVEDASEALLGVLPLEGMDLMVDTINHKLVGAHGGNAPGCTKRRKCDILEGTRFGSGVITG
jgi:hypothetical protein